MKRQKILSSQILGSVIRHVMAKVADRKVYRVSKKCSDIFLPVIAKNEAQKDKTFAFRYAVYSKELGLKPENMAHMENDQFDEFSPHCYLNYNPNKMAAGTVRLVRPTRKGQKIPIQAFLSAKIDKGEIHPNDFKSSKICEISRLAIPRHFRHRALKSKKLILPGSVDLLATFKRDKKYFSYIAIGLYFAALSIVNREGINRCFVMIEPRLAKSLKYIGLPFEQIGPVTLYYGLRAPYYIRSGKIPNQLKHGFSALYKHIGLAVAAQLRQDKTATFPSV